MDANCGSQLIVAASKECVSLVVVARIEHNLLASLGFCCGKGAACIGVAGPGEHNSSLTLLPVISGRTWKQKPATLSESASMSRNSNKTTKTSSWILETFRSSYTLDHCWKTLSTAKLSRNTSPLNTRMTLMSSTRNDIFVCNAPCTRHIFYFSMTLPNREACERTRLKSMSCDKPPASFDLPASR